MTARTRQRESDVLRLAAALLRLRGCSVERRNVGQFTMGYKGRTRTIRAGTKGAADLWGVLPDGRHFECEVKAPGQRPRPDQVAWLMRFNSPFCVCFWVDNVRTLAVILDIVLGGGWTVFHESIRTYRIKGKSVIGYTGDFDLYGEDG